MRTERAAKREIIVVWSMTRGEGGLILDMVGDWGRIEAEYESKIERRIAGFSMAWGGGSRWVYISNGGSGKFSSELPGEGQIRVRKLGISQYKQVFGTPEFQIAAVDIS